MYKLVCIDMDDTFLDDKKRISARNMKAVRAASDKGVKVAVCTGRLFASARYYANLIGIDVPVIASNGAYIREKDEGRIICKEAITIKNCIDILKIFKKYNTYPHFNTSYHVITEKITGSSLSYQNMNKILPVKSQIQIEVTNNWKASFEKHDGDILKCIVVENDNEKLSSIKKELAAHDEFEVVSSGKNNVEVMKRGISKGKAAQVLAGFYNIKREEVMCIGNSENDLSMIKYAGLGIAVKNSDDILKKASQYITDTNNDDGVAKAIEKFIL